MYRYIPNFVPPPRLPPPPPHKPFNNHTKPPIKKKKSLCFKSLKKETCTSLNDVEHFLYNLNFFIKYIKLYNLLKK